MKTALRWVGRLGGIAGVLLSALAVLSRALGTYNIAGFQVGTLLLAGAVAMLVGCLGYLVLLVEHPNN